MGIAEKIVKAHQSKSLKHREQHCDVDVLGAVGMAAISNPVYLSLWRLKFENDQAEREACRTWFIMQVRRSIERRGIADEFIRASGRVASQALHAWLFDKCPVCTGIGHLVIQGTPSLDARDCPGCSGSGVTRIRQHPPVSDVISDVIDMANIAVRAVPARTKERMD